MFEIDVGVAAVAAGVVERQLAAVDAVLAPVDGVLLRHQLGFDADLAQLIGDHFADFFAFEVAVRREIELGLESVRITGFGQSSRAFFGS